MPEKSYFFTAVETSPGIYDRVYTAAEYADYFARFLTNGIYNGGTNLQVSATGLDMKTAIAPGYAWINGYMYKVHTSPVAVTHDTADALYNRIDRVVARWDSDARAIIAAVVKGTPAESPVAPDITRNDEIYELSLAQVLVPAASSVIPTENVTDERLDEEVCGLVNSLIKVETVQFQNQWNAWFYTNVAQFEGDWNSWFTQQQTEGFVMVENENVQALGGFTGTRQYKARELMKMMCSMEVV